MAAVILAMDADALHRRDYRAAVEQVVEFGRFVDRWKLDSRPEAVPGTEAWLLLRGSTQGNGLIGHGLVVSEPYQVPASGDAAETDWFITVAFDSLLPVGEQTGPEIIESAFPGGFPAGASVQSLVAVPPGSEPALRRLWRGEGPATTEPGELPGGTFHPSAARHVQVNRYERDPDARRLCLAFHGTSCAACGFSFEATYGVAGAAMVAVHHLVPAEMLGNGYQLDPVADLVPLCRNCHTVAHGENPPRTVAELRTMATAGGHVAGHVVSMAQLQAQADARRILEGGPA
ncbi:restriction endonuclease [Pseudarthrobacter sp. efr-133-R2A-89]|uniref:HNH endonuclease n=1 Tax=Pseudarthrobacter sp. efr-133-R2A-89 TaxID=3040302 RepID=UPI002552F1D6|nr:restriction endonuclease [Pseudarthrobacter sp. efr-133-R2A-89]